MATLDSKALEGLSPNPHLRQLQLFSLISTLCPPRHSRQNSDLCRLIIDSRLQWAVEPIDGNTSWLYLPQAAHARQLAGCTVVTVD
jgi:hypothetical protein